VQDTTVCMSTLSSTSVSREVRVYGLCVLVAFTLLILKIRRHVNVLFEWD
jgi:hypothetical protein